MKKNIRIAIVVSRFNKTFTNNLLKCCERELLAHHILKSHVHVLWVPGSFELPYAVYRLASSKRYAAVIGLGCIIKGETTHDVHVANWAAFGLGLSSLLTGVPCLFGVLTPKNESQAKLRSRPGPLNRGKEVAEAALEMIQLRSNRSL